jgi:glycosyltransferase involved in cell wall biosynthesis
MRDLECLVAREADLVLTLSGPLKSELVRRGVPAGKISLAPNAVDVEHFRPMAPDLMLGRSLGLEGRFVIGFLGSLTNYEGLEDLVAALAGIVQDGIDAALLIVGDGDAAAGVRAATQRQGLTDRVVMVGRVPSADVPRYYALIDVAAFRRLPFKVCELVPPLKPFEAMAMAKPVIASDLPALAEVVEHGKTGLLFPSGDRAALAAALRMLAEHPARREALGTAGRAFVMRERTWMAVAAGVRAAYAELFEAAHAGVFEQAA